MKRFTFRYFLGSLLLLLFTTTVFAVDNKDLPARPSPERLVNDMAGLMTPGQRDELEKLVVDFDRTTSTQIAIVTMHSLGGYEASEYATQLGQYWGVGRKGKNNGIVILVALDDRKMAIATGYGVEGALTDAISGRIVRNEMVPEFKNRNYYKGLENAVRAIIAATKGEYTNDDPPDAESPGGGGGIAILIFIAIIIIIVLAVIKGGGGKGGGGYMSRRGSRATDFITGAILGSILNGGGRSSGGSGWGGGSSGGGDGFGGFGGGSFGGGGASGSW